jgi:hypothetical protein
MATAPVVSPFLPALSQRRAFPAELPGRLSKAPCNAVRRDDPVALSERWSVLIEVLGRYVGGKRMHWDGKQRARVLALGMAALVGSTVGTANANDSINVGKLNKALGSIVREVLEVHQATPKALFRALEFKIEERGTILDEEDRFAAKARITAVAARSRWSPNRETALGADVAIVADRKKQEATLEVAGSLETDTLRLLRFAAGELVVDWCRPKEPARPTDRDYCETMKRLAAAPTLADVIGSVVGLGDIAIRDAKAAVITAEKALADAPESEKTRFQERVDAARKELAKTEAVAAELKRGQAAGAATSTLRLAFRDVDAGSYGEFRDVELFLDSGRVEAKLKYTMRDIRDIDDYFAMKPAVLLLLKKLETGSEEVAEDIKRLLEQYLDLAASLIQGD